MTSEILRASLYDDRDGRVRLVLEGELDLATVPMFGAKLAEACKGKPAELRIDLTGLTYLDSSGLREFVRAADVCASNDTKLTLAGARRSVHQIFVITDLADDFSFE